MDELSTPRFDDLETATRKKRSQTSRRRRPDAQTLVLAYPQLYNESHDLSPLPSAPVSGDLCRLSSDENVGDANSRVKVFNLNQCISRCPSATNSDGNYCDKKIKEDGASGANGTLGDGADQGHGSSSANPGIKVSSVGNENKLKKVKLRVGGVTRTIQAKSSSNSPLSAGASSGGASAKLAQPLDSSRSRKLILQENSDGDQPLDKKSGMQGTFQKGVSRGSASLRKEDMGKIAGKGAFEKQAEKSDSVRKSKRVPKRRVLDRDFDEDDDDEIRYLEKLKTSKVVGYKDFDEESVKKQRKVSGLSKVGKYENLDDSGRVGKDGKRSRSERGSEDTDYEEEELGSEFESEGKKKHKQKKDASTSPTDSKREVALTTRQRALLLNKDASGASQIEFPNGLPPPPPRKQKEKLTEVEQQLKKAEAAQRRRLQNEKAARESEAEAIRKILGQDSSRKKREEKMKKRQEELAQEKAATALMLASNTVRWVMGPNGTVVTFPQQMGLPKIFETEVKSYPPAREKCVGPFCTNPYKYRDSKSKLPLCSLQCYKAIHAMQAETTC